MAAAGAENSREIVITFEDLRAQGQAMGPLPSGYAGLMWSDSAWFMTKDFASSVCPRVRCGLLNAHARDITIESTHLFDLKGLSLCALWSDNVQVLVEGWEKQVRRYAETLTAKQDSVTLFNLAYHAIDRVELKAGGAHVLITAIIILFK